MCPEREDNQEDEDESENEWNEYANDSMDGDVDIEEKAYNSRGIDEQTEHGRDDIPDGDWTDSDIGEVDDAFGCMGYRTGRKYQQPKGRELY